MTGKGIAAVSKDVRARSSLIIEELTKRGDGDLKKMLPKLPSVRTATILNYSGNCSHCPAESLVCSGISEGCWWVKSAYPYPWYKLTEWHNVKKFSIFKFKKNNFDFNVIFQLKYAETDFVKQTTLCNDFQEIVAQNSLLK